SGIAGAGPLLRRVVLATAGRRAPGLLPSPAAFGAERVRVCRVSGLAATRACDAMDEWRLAGAAPLPPDDWHQDGAVVLPARFAEWERTQVRRAFASAASQRTRSSGDTTLTLVSPRDGDVYVLPAGPERAVATIALSASGVEAGAVLRWSIDGQPHAT